MKLLDKKTKIASIDIGLKRIGCAVSLLSGIITPVEPILRKNRKQAAKDVDHFLNSWDINILVVGYPKASEEMMRRIDHFVSLLKYSKEKVFINENMSSIEVKELIKGKIKQKRDGRIDSLSAKIILQRYLDTK